MLRLCRFIVEKRYIFILAFAAAVAVSVFLIPRVNVKYDLTAFLPENSATAVGVAVNEEEFGNTGIIKIMLTNAGADRAKELAARLRGKNIPNVINVDFKETPEYLKDGNALIRVMLRGGDAAPATVAAVKAIREEAGAYGAELGGGAVSTLAMNESVTSQTLLILLIAIPIVLLILFLASQSFFEPLLFAAVIGCAAVINMGTNYFLGGVSYITQSVAVMLLLALSMDYAIIFLHRYREELLTRPRKEAVIYALKRSVTSVSASCLTTVAGFTAIMFMQLKIGYDLGMVLSKGILISLLAVFLLMPGLVLITGGLLEKTKHRDLIPKPKFISAFGFKTKNFVPFIMAAVVALSFFIQRNVKFSFKDGVSNYAPDKKIEAVFGKSSPVMVLVPKGDYGKEKGLTEKVLSLGGVSEAQTLLTLPELSAYGLDLGRKLTAAEFIALINAGGGVTVPSDPLTLLALAVFIKSNFGLDLTGDFYLIDVAKAVIANADRIDGIKSDMESNPLLAPMSGLFDSPLFVSLLASKDDLSYAVSLFEGERYARLIFYVSEDLESEKAAELVKSLRAAAPEFYGEHYIVGDAVFIYDLKNAFNADVLKISLLTALFIFIILLVSFLSLGVPILLLLAILGAVWLNFALSALLGQSVIFLGYLIVSGIQTGATIDYAIVLTERYRQARKTADKRQAAAEAVKNSLPTILTSGGIMILAGAVIGLISSVPTIGGLGSLLARGTLISVLMTLFVLPGALMLCDKIIDKTTLKRKEKDKDKYKEKEKPPAPNGG